MLIHRPPQSTCHSDECKKECSQIDSCQILKKARELRPPKSRSTRRHQIATYSIRTKNFPQKPNQSTHHNQESVQLAQGSSTMPGDIGNQTETRFKRTRTHCIHKMDHRSYSFSGIHHQSLAKRPIFKHRQSTKNGQGDKFITENMLGSLLVHTDPRCKIWTRFHTSSST